MKRQSRSNGLACHFTLPVPGVLGRDHSALYYFVVLLRGTCGRDASLCAESVGPLSSQKNDFLKCSVIPRPLGEIYEQGPFTFMQFVVARW